MHPRASDSAEPAASFRMASGNVAENSSVRRFCGSACTTWRSAGMKPMSSMRSASSSVSISIFDRSIVRFCMRSMSRPGVATMTSAPRRSEDLARRMPTPPKMTATRRRASAAYAFNESAPAARAHASAPARARAAPSMPRLPSRSIIGRPNAAVLPVPVWARDEVDAGQDDRNGLVSNGGRVYRASPASDPSWTQPQLCETCGNILTCP